MMTEFDFNTDNLVTVSTDGAANMLAAVKQISKELHAKKSALPYKPEDHYKGLPCLAHKINLVVQWGILNSPLLKAAIEKVKAIVTFFKHNTSCVTILEDSQLEENKTIEYSVHM